MFSYFDCCSSREKYIKYRKVEYPSIVQCSICKKCFNKRYIHKRALRLDLTFCSEICYRFWHMHGL